MNALGKTDVGLRRHENQDTFAVEQGEKLLIAVVCDGMGGTNGGRLRASFTSGHDYLSSSSTTS